MSTTTYGSISQRTAAWASKEMLAHAMPIEVLARHGASKPVPKNTAEGAKFRRPIPFPAATTPLTEGVTPAGRAMQYEDVSVTLNQYGDYVEITDKVMDMAEDPVLKDSSKLCGEQAAETIEQILWGVLRGGTAVTYLGASSSIDTRVEIVSSFASSSGAYGVTALRNVVRALKAQRAKMVTSMLAGSPNYKTEPVGAAFLAFGHTDFEADLRALPNFVPVELYGGAQKALPYEVGKHESVRFILSPVFTPFYGTSATTAAVASTGMKSTGGYIDVYPLVVVGMDAYASVALRGANAMEPKVLNPGVPRGGDPLGQRGSVGWKTYFAGLRLNELWMNRVEAAVTA
jgi:N4-gp56 family major capsid protein